MSRIKVTCKKLKSMGFPQSQIDSWSSEVDGWSDIESNLKLSYVKPTIKAFRQWLSFQ